MRLFDLLGLDWIYHFVLLGLFALVYKYEPHSCTVHSSPRIHCPPQLLCYILLLLIVSVC